MHSTFLRRALNATTKSKCRPLWNGLAHRPYATQAAKSSSGSKTPIVALAFLAGVGLSSTMMYPSSPSGQAALPNSKVQTPSQEKLKQAFDRLQHVLPPEHVTVDEDILQNHGYSSNSYHNEGAPNIVVFPRNTQEVVEIVKIANELG